MTAGIGGALFVFAALERRARSPGSGDGPMLSNRLREAHAERGWNWP